MTPQAKSLATKLLKTPPAKMEAFFERHIAKHPERQEIVRHLEGIAYSAATAASYVDARVWGDDHAGGVRCFNRTGRKIWKDALGYNAHQDLSF